MNIQRRTMLKSTLTASAISAVAGRVQSATSEPEISPREYYDLRAYRLKDGASGALLEGYLENALLPALEKRNVKDVGVFNELEVNKSTATAIPKANAPIWVLIPHSSLESFASVSAEINLDPVVQQAGADYLNTNKDNPAFDRIDSWLLRAFAGMPQHQVPAFSRNRTPTRIFEMRDYESHSELKAFSKMAMFNDGEIDLMKDLGMSPVLYGQALAGPNLPHLRYITSAVDLATHLENWKKFGQDPRWKAMKGLPQYAGSVSKGTARFLTPMSYSQI
jgi:hypothetical protein